MKRTKNPRRSMLAITGLVVAFGGSGASATPPLSTYYLTVGDRGINWIINGTSATSYNQTSSFQYPIAVGSTIRTLGYPNGTGGPGTEYTLAGTPTGVTFAYPNVNAQFVDGTRNATHNFSVDFNTGNVYQMNLDWSSPTLLFNAGTGTFNSLGITYEPANNSLWISQWTSATVTDYSLTGQVLSSFSTAHADISGLALDPADGTLWMGSQLTEGTFYQYSTAGTLLNTQAYPAMAGQNTLGGEFAYVVPEPSSIGLLCVAALATGARRRKRG